MIATDGQRQDVRIIGAYVAAIAVAAGIGVVVAGASPTGSTLVDVFVILLFVGLSVALIATAPWMQKWSGTMRPVIAAAIVAVAIQVLARLGNIFVFGVSAAIAMLPLLTLVLFAIHQRTGRQRIVLWSLFGGLVAAALLGLLGFGVAAAAARPNLTRGADEAKLALHELKSGDFDGARQGFVLAAGLLGGASDDLGAPWAQPSRLIPVVAQHRRAAVRVAESAQSVSDTIAQVLDDIDFDRLRVVNGSIDLSAISALEQPLDELNASLADLRSAVDSVDSPWLVDPVRDRLRTFSQQIDDQQAEEARATLAVQRAPAMLGANGKKVYFIAFTTPSEARGLGGFMGNWAEVTMDAGHISVTGFGRTADLAVDGDTEHWVRITTSPDFPEVAHLIADGYPAYSGHPIDGVLAMDVYTVAALMTMTGPIDLTSLPMTVSADNVVKFLLHDQYSLVQNRTDRIDMLEEVAGTTINKLLTTSLPKPPDLIKLLAPFAAQGRLLGWSTNVGDEDLFSRMNMSGELPTLDGGDGLGVVIDNVGNNKIDYYVSGELFYNVTTNAAVGRATASLDITLHNSAPTDVNDPGIVFGNSVGAPSGTDVTQLNLYSVLPATEITVDGVPRPADANSSASGFAIAQLNLQIAPQTTMQVHVELAGPLNTTDGYHLILRNQAAVSPLRNTIVIDGQSYGDSQVDLGGLHRFDP